MSLTKADLIDTLYKRVNLPKAKSTQVVETLLEIIKETLANGEEGTLKPVMI